MEIPAVLPTTHSSSASLSQAPIAPAAMPIRPLPRFADQQQAPAMWQKLAQAATVIAQLTLWPTHHR